MGAFIKAVKVVIALMTYRDRSSKKVTIIDRTYTGENDENIPIKIFKPKGKSTHNLVIYPGASPFGEEHPGMIMLGSVLSFAGFTIYMPRIPLLKELKINNDIVQSLHHFYNWLLLKEGLNHQNISLVGMSFSGAMVLKASFQNSMIKNPPKSIFVYGTYYDFDSSVEFLKTGKVTVNGSEIQITPHPWGLVVLFHNYLPFVDIGYDTSDIQRIISLRVRDKEKQAISESKNLPKTPQDIITNILSGTPNEEVSRIIQIFRKEMKKEYQSLSPRYWHHKIRSKVFIFHGANDSMIPFTESILLSEKIQNSELFISHIYEHREISTNKGYLFKLKEVWKMIKFFQKFIQYNEN